MSVDGLVSVIIPTFNRAAYLNEAIQSVLRQTWQSWEIIVLDDGSTDSTQTVVEQFADTRIRYYRFEHTGRISQLRNKGLKSANGEYVAFLDSDDLWEPNKLEFQLQLLTRFPNAMFCFSHAKQFGDDAIPPPELDALFVGNLLKPQLLEERFVLYPTTFISKESVLRSAGYLDEDVSGGETDFFLRIASKHDGIFTGELLARLRKHKQNISKEREFIFCHENIHMLQKFRHQGLISKKEFNDVASKQYYRLGILCLKRSLGKQAASTFLKFVTLKPFSYKGYIRIIQSFIPIFR